MSRRREAALKQAKEARGSGLFCPFTTEMLRSDALTKLSPYACKLLLDIASQWRLGRNGDASIAFEKTLRQRGWRSKATLHKALKELLASGLIVMTRQGGLHCCSLFALGWLAIDECDGKLDVQPTKRPINNWMKPPVLADKKVLSTATVPHRANRTVLGSRGEPEG
jgi:hypothetical protein